MTRHDPGTGTGAGSSVGTLPQDTPDYRQDEEPLELLEAQAAEHAPSPVRRALPYAPAAEAAVLGAMAVSDDARATALGLGLDAAHFTPGHARWFAAIRAVAELGQAPDTVTLPAAIGADAWARAGGDDGWARVLAGAIGVGGVRSWAEEVLACHRRRMVLFATEEVARVARDGGDLDEALRSLATDTGPARTGGSWDPLDAGATVDAVLAGAVERPAPTVGTVERGRPLFYAGRVNGLHGATGTGKTMLLQAITVALLAEGEVVWFVDFEDDEVSCVTRLLELGADPDAVRSRLRYRRPTEVLTAATLGRLEQELATDRPALVAVDSTGEWMAVEGTEQSDTDVARWFDACPRRLTTSGAAVVLLDHVPMSEKDRLDPIGSHRKRAAITGAQYLVTTTAELARGQRGTAKLTTAKDRHGWRPKGTHAADFALDATEPADGPLSPLRWSLSAPGRPVSQPEPYDALGACMADVTTMLSTKGATTELTTSKVRAALRDAGHGYRDALVSQALARLVDDGVLTQTLGPRNAHLYTLNPDPCPPMPTDAGQGSAPLGPATGADRLPPPVGGSRAPVRAGVDSGGEHDAA